MGEHTSEILARLDAIGVKYELFTHQPLLHASDRLELGLDFGARVCKSLFLTTRNESAFYVLFMRAELTADLRRIARAIGSSRLCFASDERLWQLMGQRPGMVSPLGVICDKEHRVTVMIDAELRGQRICMHPSDNAMTVAMEFPELERYLKAHGAKVFFIEP